MPEPTPVPPFTRRLARPVADRVQATAAPRPRRRRRTVLVLATTSC